VISTHQVHEIAEDVDRVVVLADGQIRFDGTASQMQEQGASAAGQPVSLAEAFAAMVGGGRH
jgi:ABC-type multidrug transport system ATPase subunit